MELPVASLPANKHVRKLHYARAATRGLLRPPSDGCKVHDGQFGFEVSEKNDRRGGVPMTTTTTTTTASSSATARITSTSGAAAGVPALQRGERARARRGADAHPIGCAAQCRPVLPLHGAVGGGEGVGAIPRGACPALAQWLQHRHRGVLRVVRARAVRQRRVEPAGRARARALPRLRPGLCPADETRRPKLKCDAPARRVPRGQAVRALATTTTRTRTCACTATAWRTSRCAAHVRRTARQL